VVEIEEKCKRAKDDKETD
jgi:cilia- and flagella-associated protein 57